MGHTPHRLTLCVSLRNEWNLLLAHRVLTSAGGALSSPALCWAPAGSFQPGIYGLEFLGMFLSCFLNESRPSLFSFLFFCIVCYSDVGHLGLVLQCPYLLSYLLPFYTFTAFYYIHSTWCLKSPIKVFFLLSSCRIPKDSLPSPPHPSFFSPSALSLLS